MRKQCKWYLRGDVDSNVTETLFLHIYRFIPFAAAVCVCVCVIEWGKAKMEGDEVNGKYPPRV